jgi:hypothetical protein
MKRAMQALLVIWTLQIAAPGQEPLTMTRLVVPHDAPNIREGSFPAMPKTMYRAGTRYCRIEESPDDQHGIHGLLIVNEPDEWLINSQTKTGQHFVDPGPTFNCRLPIFISAEQIHSESDINKPLMDLEFGKELTFFENQGASPSDGPNLQGKTTKAYTANIANSQFFLFTSGMPERPVAVTRQRGDDQETFGTETTKRFHLTPKSLFHLTVSGLKKQGLRNSHVPLTFVTRTTALL